MVDTDFAYGFWIREKVVADDSAYGSGKVEIGSLGKLGKLKDLISLMPFCAALPRRDFMGGENGGEKIYS